KRAFKQTKPKAIARAWSNWQIRNTSSFVRRGHPPLPVPPPQGGRERPSALRATRLRRGAPLAYSRRTPPPYPRVANPNTLASELLSTPGSSRRGAYDPVAPLREGSDCAERNA